ncbi:hypothetical protein VKT23_009590 [Stygiomarasmius scandens]|uniref:Uncharacterized protein n=1 Tax=Marasmiellus scandens TaxID=2682957 RepID=A0ABR1JGR5_9AGAR
MKLLGPEPSRAQLEASLGTPKMDQRRYGRNMTHQAKEQLLNLHIMETLSRGTSWRRWGTLSLMALARSIGTGF